MKLSTRTGLLVICTVLGFAVQLEATHLSGRVQQDQQGISLLQLLMYIIDYSVSVKCPWDLISYPVGKFRLAREYLYSASAGTRHEFLCNAGRVCNVIVSRGGSDLTIEKWCRSAVLVRKRACSVYSPWQRCKCEQSLLPLSLHCCSVNAQCSFVQLCVSE